MGGKQLEDAAARLSSRQVSNKEDTPNGSNQGAKAGLQADQGASNEAASTIAPTYPAKQNGTENGTRKEAISGQSEHPRNPGSHLCDNYHTTSPFQQAQALHMLDTLQR